MRNGYHAQREVITAAGAVAVKAPRVNDTRTDPDTGDTLSLSSIDTTKAPPVVPR